MARILVPFEGPGSGTAELTWGQRGLWRAHLGSGRSLVLAGAQPLRPGVTVERVAAGLTFLLGRHQALRTRLCFDAGGRPRQQLFAAGQVPLDLVEAGTADPAAVAGRIQNRYERTEFDFAGEWPVRMTVVLRDGTPSRVVAAYSHLAVDAYALRTIVADLFTMDPVTGRSAAPVTGVQPLELARRQREPAALRQSEASLRHLERVLRAVPARRFTPVDGGWQPRYQTLEQRSPAVWLAARTVAARAGLGTAPVLLAGFAVALARRTGGNPVVLLLAVSNRFRPGFGAAVGSLAQVSPCVLDVAGISVAAAAARAHRASMLAYKHAYYDPDRRAELVARVSRERGTEIDLSCYVNDRRPPAPPPTGPHATEAELRQARSAGRLRWVTVPGLSPDTLSLDLYEAPGAVDLTLSADTEQLSPADMVAVLRGLEDVLVAAAVDPAAGTGVPAGDGTG